MDGPFGTRPWEQLLAGAAERAGCVQGSHTLAGRASLQGTWLGAFPQMTRLCSETFLNTRSLASP